MIFLIPIQTIVPLLFRTQVTIPANHSAVALLKLAQLPYNGATSLFIRVLLNKKYALPYKVNMSTHRIAWCGLGRLGRLWNTFVGLWGI